jgi:hypothetical protein
VGPYRNELEGLWILAFKLAENASPGLVVVWVVVAFLALAVLAAILASCKALTIHLQTFYFPAFAYHVTIGFQRRKLILR